MTRYNTDIQRMEATLGQQAIYYVVATAIRNISDRGKVTNTSYYYTQINSRKKRAWQLRECINITNNTMISRINIDRYGMQPL